MADSKSYRHRPRTAVRSGPGTPSCLRDRRSVATASRPERPRHCAPFLAVRAAKFSGLRALRTLRRKQIREPSAPLRSGDHLGTQDHAALASATRVILETRSVSKLFGGFRAVNNVSLRIREGTIHSLIGPNGAGKTTLFNLLTKFLKPTAGTIWYEGRDITAMRPAKLARAGVARSFQISATFSNMTVLENVRIALQRGHCASLNFWNSRKAVCELDRVARDLLAEVGLDALAERPAAVLTYGGKRALELATTLALKPRILLLDEPMAGLAAEEINRITALIRRAAKGRTVVLVEHNLGVVADLSDEITVLQRGEILASGNYGEVSQKPEVIEAYMGTGDV
jgi:branched-chain amino acid transport system ATP-binding protein